WTALRYYSSEEDADDTSVLVLRGTKFAPAAIGDFFLSIIPGPAGAQCKTMADARAVPPYGVDLSDEPHGTCCRTYNVNALERNEQAQSTSAPRRNRTSPGEPVFTRKAFVTLDDQVKY